MSLTPDDDEDQYPAGNDFEEEATSSLPPLSVVPDKVVQGAIDQLIARIEQEPEIVQNLPELRIILQRSLVQVTRSSMWSAPQPPPDIIREYEATTPGIGRELWDDFFAEGRHRRESDRQFLETQDFLQRADSARQDKGLYLTVVASMVFLGAAVFLAWHDKTYVAIVCLSVPLLVLIIGLLSGGNSDVLGRLADRIQGGRTD